LFILLACGICEGAFAPNRQNKQFLNYRVSNRMTTAKTTTTLYNAMNGDDDGVIRGRPFNETAYNDQAMTKNDFLRDVMNDDDDDGENGEDLEAVVKRKKKGRGNKKYSGYKTVDNRDSLPFEVRMTTPDPYNTESQAKLQKKQLDKLNKELKKKGKKMRRTDLQESMGIAADIYKEEGDGSFAKVLGKYQLDKSTTNGDLLEIGDKNFEVTRARCQYKYAGGSKFVMVRKILEVKEVSRMAQEASILRQFNNDASSNVPPSER